MASGAEATISDRARWNQKYAAGEGPAHFEPTAFLVENSGLLRGSLLALRGQAYLSVPDRHGQVALDVACGFGGNALYLAERGWTVDAVDVSEVALHRARAEAGRRDLLDHLHLVQADVDRFWLPPVRYDLVLVFFYLNRSLMPRLARTLRPGGLLFQGNRNKRHLAARPDFSPAYLLELGELPHLAEAAGLHVVYTADPGSDSLLIARRPGGT